jgi:hypothetical protein
MRLDKQTSYMLTSVRVIRGKDVGKCFSERVAYGTVSSPRLRTT